MKPTNEVWHTHTHGKKMEHFPKHKIGLHCSVCVCVYICKRERLFDCERKFISLSLFFLTGRRSFVQWVSNFVRFFFIFIDVDLHLGTKRKTTKIACLWIWRWETSVHNFDRMDFEMDAHNLSQWNRSLISRIYLPWANPIRLILIAICPFFAETM